ncbi:Coiled-coil domain-containing protein 112 [Heterocephalus glaber]|uniref:Coiled-coil domain-containing protein 112 n=1 Tax=Heterocephalus glaber TaxID=10181 RepID=G5C1J3_HETGA|nr:Coiled-coil domain-containing protein 112 [Heterocephalus glaber]
MPLVEETSLLEDLSVTLPVVIIGNGPSGISLSYMLSGYRPYLSSEAIHPNAILHSKLEEARHLSTVDQDLEYLSEGLEGRSSNPVAVLFDTLFHPDADFGYDCPSILLWKLEQHHYIPHLVLDKGPPGGAWHNMEGSILTISFGNWMELPGLKFKDWVSSKRRDLKGDRVMPEEIARYYKHYVKVMELQKNFRENTYITSVSRLYRDQDDSDGQDRDISTEHLQIEKSKFVKRNWEIRGYQQIADNDGCFSTSGGIHPFQLQNWKQKVSRTKKAEFIRTAEKFKNQVIIIEKDKHSHFYNQKNDFRIEHSMLEELENKLINSRKMERAKIQQQLAKIHNNVKKLQHQLKDVKPTPDFVEKLREMMEEIENAINTFKEEQRLIYDELIKEEKATNNELSAISRKIDTWAVGNSETEKAFRAISSKVSVDKMTPNTLPAAVVDFEKFLQQTGGRHGGWDNYDHQNFIKVRNKHKGKPAFMKEVLEHLPGRTQDEVQQHEKWFQKFLTLEERQKEPEGNQKQKEEERKKQKLAVEAWKKQKSTELSMKYASKLKEEEEKKKKQQKEGQRQLKLKLLLESYTQQKKEQEEFLRLEKEIREKAEKAEKRKTVADEISRFQERDLYKLELKILDRQAKEEEKAEKQRRLAKLKEKVENNVSRDPSRLYKSTKGWEERTKSIGPTGSGPLLHIPHRAVPTWRQGI